MRRAADTAVTTTGRAGRSPNVVPRPQHPRRLALVGLIAASAVWGLLVDSPAVPLLRPTGNSTLFQASTAAAFALLGILFGPLAGALGGLLRDGPGYVATLALHPGIATHPGFLSWLVAAAVDVFEDVVLGWLPGLVGQRTRRMGPLVTASAATAWLSLPFLVAGTALAYGHAGDVWAALTTRAGDWNEPVDPGLTVYALLTGAMVAFALARRSARPRASLLIGTACLAPALALIALGAHP